MVNRLHPPRLTIVILNPSDRLLISFYNHRVQVVKAIGKAISVNRVGDVMLLVGVVMMLGNHR